MKEYLKVEGYSELVRDRDSHAIINTDTSTYKSYMKGVESRRREKESLQDAVREINSLKCEMHEIKSLLMQMMDKK
jgi:hypothetical protein